ncbi:DUF3575 domain-containing protein [Flammeovirga pacifica]|uniref:Outer membrane protein beta-barrel domain-containing protein n=1 Tax=Flammeovirga pacifica TaxID=915059 RepID=A0A1S1Z3T6_FLAPC|nr:DUF3575 domain-containing protein [Flammeovirga pacifica]OHX67892.1 hypothetical protein NH26_16880 [Flammeovirga pacifica]
MKFIKFLYLGTLLTLMTLAQLTAQNKNNAASNFSNGSDFYVNAGVGFNGRGVPFYLGLDYNALHPDISLGGSFGINNWEEYHHNHYHKYNSWNITFNGNYHFNKIMNIPNNFDFYAGANIGYYQYSESRDDIYYDDHRKYHNGIGVGIQVGGRWFFTEKIGLNLQFGGGTQYTAGNFGVTIRL